MTYLEEGAAKVSSKVYRKGSVIALPRQDGISDELERYVVMDVDCKDQTITVRKFGTSEVTTHGRGSFAVEEPVEGYGRLGDAVEQLGVTPLDEVDYVLSSISTYSGFDRRLLRGLRNIPLDVLEQRKDEIAAKVREAIVLGDYRGSVFVEDPLGQVRKVPADSLISAADQRRKVEMKIADLTKRAKFAAESDRPVQGHVLERRLAQAKEELKRTFRDGQNTGSRLLLPFGEDRAKLVTLVAKEAATARTPPTRSWGVAKQYLTTLWGTEHYTPKGARSPRSRDHAYARQLLRDAVPEYKALRDARKAQ